MASLNGQTINSTYQGLIKFIDNGQVTVNTKELTDGYGNPLGVHMNATGNLETEGNLSVQGTIDSSGANKIAFYYNTQSDFPDATTYHGAIAHSHADGRMYFAHAGSWLAIANQSEVAAALGVDDTTIENVADTLQVKDAGISSAKLANESVSSDKLSNEFKTATTLTPTSGAQDLDFTSAQVFNVVMTEDTTFTFSNDGVGMVKDLLLSGDFAPTFPVGVNTIAGTYDGAVENLIQIVTTDAGEYWMSISKAI